jgi:tetratricopeptide (TPR) repeat protein
MRSPAFAAAALAGLIALAGHARADQATDQTMAIAQEWATIKYGSPGDSQEGAMESLRQKAEATVGAFPDRAEPLVWDGIVTSTLAGLKGGFGGLSLARQALGLLQRAERINADALDGSVHTSLGALYYQVPGWPVGFGDNRKAREQLQAALKIAPAGIDANYFWGDFQYRQGNYAEAVKALTTALEAPDRPGRAAADAGRRGEAAKLLADAKGKLKG